MKRKIAMNPRFAIGLNVVYKYANIRCKFFEEDLPVFLIIKSAVDRVKSRNIRREITYFNLDFC